MDSARDTNIESVRDMESIQSMGDAEEVDGVQGTNDAQAVQGSQVIKDEFHFYPRLPAEIKLMIWEFAQEELWTMGAHCFRLRLNPEDPTRLVVEPHKYNKEDASAWRERHAIARVDKYSFDRMLKFERLAPIICQDTWKKRGAQVDENRSLARASNDDLTTFWFNYGVSRASLCLISTTTNENAFAGITQIGIEIGHWDKGYQRVSKFRPFQCYCPNRGAWSTPYCDYSFVRFIELFRDLKSFYVICPIKPEYIVNQKATVCSALKPPAPRKLAQEKLDTFSFFQAMARDKGLKQFHDRMGAYCEVSDADIDEYMHAEFRYRLVSLERLCHFSREWSNLEPKAIKFGILIWCDLRGVTDGQTGRQLRSPSPWQ
ncbi:hypothetical protein ONZ43_g5870 [Nemania bipapillata]|uniref:Uncharacterized protein n=1 Tax=Nemania bipapillata TaxID=110536 RepID=A0ACC2I5X6_9PEZI|nr:hypothetical protein ONZ43_g5870 [Nemania bipapillata]